MTRTKGTFINITGNSTTALGLRLSFVLNTANATVPGWNCKWFVGNGTITSNSDIADTWYTPGYGFQLTDTAAYIYKTSGNGINTTTANATLLICRPLTVANFHPSKQTSVQFEQRTNGLVSLTVNGTLIADCIDPTIARRIDPIPPVFVSGSITLSANCFLRNTDVINQQTVTGEFLGFDDIVVSYLSDNGEKQDWIASSPNGPVGNTTATTAAFGKKPAFNTHPRVLVSAGNGTGTIGALRSMLKPLGVPTIQYTRLTSLTGLLEIDKFGNRTATGTDYLTLSANSTSGNYSSVNGTETMGQLLHYKAFIALIDGNRTVGEEVARALVNYAPLHTVRKIDNVSSPDVNVAMAYDYAYEYMDDTQRRDVRNAISAGLAFDPKNPLSVRGKLSGEDTPGKQRDFNLNSNTMYRVLMALSIQGETGVSSSVLIDPILTQGREILGDFLTYGIDEQGVAYEDTQYFNFGMRHGALAMVAFCRENGPMYENLFFRPNYKSVRRWLVQAIEPFGREFSMHDDTQNSSGGVITNYVVMKTVWPDDPLIDRIWKNRAGNNFGNATGASDVMSVALFMPPDPGLTAYDAPANTTDSNTWPLTWMGRNRALFVARSGWDANATAIHVECNPELKGPGHQHSNSGDFTLSALGRKWAIERGYHYSDSNQHSIVQIEGIGQGKPSTGVDPNWLGNFPSPGRIVDAYSDERIAYSCVDSEYPYNWQYNFQSRRALWPIPFPSSWDGVVWIPEGRTTVKQSFIDLLAARGPTWKPASLPLLGDLLNEEPWRVGRQPTGLYDSGGQPTFDWPINYTFKENFNSVKRAFRTVTLRRGAGPYVLVFDDIEKVGVPANQYKWVMQVPDDVTIVSGSETVGTPSVSASVVLQGNSTACLRVAMVAGTAGQWTLRPNVEHLEQPLKLDTNGVPVAGKRVKQLEFVPNSTAAIAPNLKVMLYPFNKTTSTLTGEAQLALNGNNDLVVSIPGGPSDTYKLPVMEGGRTGLLLR